MAAWEHVGALTLLCKPLIQSQPLGRSLALGNTRANPRRHGPTLISWPPAPGQNPPTRQHTKPPRLDQGATSCSTGPGKKAATR